MPSFTFQCQKCEQVVKRLLPAGDRKKPQVHPGECGGALVRVGTGPTVLVKETLDNGAMPRAVERLKDAEELYRERSENDPKTKQ